MSCSLWRESHRFDPRALPLADRHYNRQKIGSPQFVPPGGCHVLLTDHADALWVSSRPFPQFVKHAWPGAWINSCFRNESPHLASELILEAIASTRSEWGEPPSLGMVTFIDRKKVRPTMVRGKKTWGYCYIKAGFKPCGETKGGLLAFQLEPCDFPEPCGAKEFRDDFPQQYSLLDALELHS